MRLLEFCTRISSGASISHNRLAKVEEGEVLDLLLVSFHDMMTSGCSVLPAASGTTEKNPLAPYDACMRMAESSE